MTGPEQEELHCKLTNMLFWRTFSTSLTQERQGGELLCLNCWLNQYWNWLTKDPSLDIWMALNYTVHSSHPSGWDGMYKDSVEYCHACPQCVVVSRDQRLGNPPLQSIPVQWPFQILGVNMVNLPKIIESGNKRVGVQGILVKMADCVCHIWYQIINHLVKDVVPMFGVS